MATTDSTFKPGYMANTAGVDAVAGVSVAVEFLAADPTTVAGEPRAWVNTAANTFKLWDGTNTFVVTVTVT
jgi:hypothetical protein